MNGSFWRRMGAAGLMAAAALAASLATAAGASATTYYVSNSGSDGNAGTSTAAPWASLAKVNATALSPGDTVAFARGDHWTGKLTISSSGTAAAPITLKGYGNGNPKPWLTYAGTVDVCGQGLTITGDHVVVDGFLFADDSTVCYANAYTYPNTAYYGGGAVYFPAGAEYNEVRNSEFRNVGIGVRIRGDHNSVQHNWFHDLHFVVRDNEGSAGSYGAIGVSIGASYADVGYNRFERCRADRGNPSRGSANYDGGAIEVEGHFYNTHDPITEVDVHHNFSRDNEGFGEVDVSDPSNVRFSYNYSDDYQHFWGFATNQYLTMGTGWVFDHNTVVKRNREIGYVFNTETYFGTTPPSYDFSTWTNNVFLLASGKALQPENDEPRNHNVYWSSRGLSASALLGAGSYGTGDVAAPPELADSDPSDPHLRATSPAVGAGTTPSPLYAGDIDGKPVPGTGATDAGASQLQGSATTPNVLQDPGFETQNSSTLQEPWEKDEGSGAVGVDHGVGGTHGGDDNAWVTTSSGWTSLAQRGVGVRPNTNYTLTCWTRDSGSVTSYLGVYYTDSKTLGTKSEQSFSGSTSYVQRSMTFNSGSYTSVNVYVGYSGTSPTSYLVVDDCSLVADNPNLLSDPGFEAQTSSTIAAPWSRDEGTGTVSVDHGVAGSPRSGSNDARIVNTSSGAWTSLGHTAIAVTPRTNYLLSCWTRDSGAVTGYLGVYYTASKTAGAKTEASFSSSGGTYRRRVVGFNSGTSTSVTPYIGYPGVASSSLVVDDCEVTRG